MESTARLVFSILMGIFFPYSMGLLFFDAQILAMYGVWGMVVTRQAGFGRALAEVAGLTLLGFLIVNLRLSDAPRIVTPGFVPFTGLMALWMALAALTVRWPAVWLPWVIGAFFWWGPPQIFLPGSIWAMAAIMGVVAAAAAKIKNPDED